MKGTERAFTGEYWDHKGEGVYACVCCGSPLFSSETKYDSGTGWPSFWEPLDEKNVETEEDRSLFMRRIEVHCAGLRGAPGPRLRRRSRADRQALLHQLGRPALRAGNRGRGVTPGTGVANPSLSAFAFLAFPGACLRFREMAYSLSAVLPLVAAPFPLLRPFLSLSLGFLRGLFGRFIVRGRGGRRRRWRGCG